MRGKQPVFEQIEGDRSRKRASARLTYLAGFRKHIVNANIWDMIDWSSCEYVEQHQDRVSGVWVFAGTRVPVSALFENLEDGAQVDEFVEWFPGVSIEQVKGVLEHAARSAAA